MGKKDRMTAAAASPRVDATAAEGPPSGERRRRGIFASASSVPVPHIILLALVITAALRSVLRGGESSQGANGGSSPEDRRRLRSSERLHWKHRARVRRQDLDGDDGFSASAAGPIGRTLTKARGGGGGDPLRVLYVVTTLSEYDKGTRGTMVGADRLNNVVIPVLQEGVRSMVDMGWDVDVYLILGYESLRQERRRLVESALPPGVGLEIWEDATPMYYKKRARQNDPDERQSVEMASHGLSRQHRYVVRDKLDEYDFFACFEDDMRITAEHAINFLELSAGIEALRIEAEGAEDGMAHVRGESRRVPSTRGKPMDKAPVGNDVVDDPLSVEYLTRVIPGFLRVEVLDEKERENTNHPLLRGDRIDSPKYSSEVPIDRSVSQSVDPNVCCREDPPGRGRMSPNPGPSDLLVWETNVGAMGVRRYPDPIGWVGALPVQDSADVGSYWSGEGGIFGPTMSRPRRLDATLGQQAGWMATRSQVEYFHSAACPGGFLPPFAEDDPHWRGDSLQRYAVEHWSGGFQLFGECRLNRILSLNPAQFSAHLLYHTANNKQRTKGPDFFIRAGDLLGQLRTVKERAMLSLQT